MQNADKLRLPPACLTPAAKLPRIRVRWGTGYELRPYL